jgi:hypothetical protein
MTTTQTPVPVDTQIPVSAATAPVRVSANQRLTRRLGNWTSSRRFQVRAHRGYAVLDLRSPQIGGGDIELDVDLDHAVLKVLVSEDAVLDDWDLRRVGRSPVKDSGPTAPAGRRIVLSGELRRAEIRVRRGGIAILSAMLTREYVADVRRAHKEGGFPTVDDPTRTA